jgi:elongation factor Ts
MTALTTDLIAQLREKTGAGMMDCKRALVEANGDIVKAQEVLRKKGLADAAKKSSRATKDGLIAASVSGSKAGLVELNCETDFVARTDAFKALVAELADGTASGKLSDDAASEAAKNAVGKLGENITLRRRVQFEMKGPGKIEAYIHSGKAGTLVELGCEKAETAGKPEFAELAKELALQVVGASPKWTDRTQVPAADVAKEREIFLEQLKKEGKPEAMLEKILPGKLNKFYQIWCLVDQPSIRDASGKTPVQSMINQAATKLGDKITVRRFVRYQLGGE